MRRSSVLASVVLSATVLVVAPSPASAALVVADVQLISAAPSGSAGNGAALLPRMTPDGRYIAFASYATDLPTEPVPAGQSQVFVYDRVAHLMEIVSRNDAGDIADWGGSPDAISDDGRFVLFRSSARNLPGYFQAPQMIGAATFEYVHDRLLHTTARVGDPALLNTYVTANAMSADGSVVAFNGMTYYNSPYDAGFAWFVVNRSAGTTVTLPAAARDAAVSVDGRFVTYQEPYTTDGGNTYVNRVYRRDLTSGATTQIADGVDALTLAPDNQHALVHRINADRSGWDLSYVDTESGAATPLHSGSTGYGPAGTAFDRTGRRVAYYVSAPADSPLHRGQAWVHDLVTGERVLVDTGLNRVPDVQLTADGSQLVFTSLARPESSDHQVYVARIGLAPDVPGTPVIAAVSVGSHSATITWLRPDDHGSPILGYTVTAQPGGASCSTDAPDALSCTISGLTNGVSYTFTVTARNATGDSPPPPPSGGGGGGTGTPVVVATPGPPPGPVDGVEPVRDPDDGTRVTLHWLAAASELPIVGYRATAAPGGQFCTTDGALSCVITGLTPGQDYTFTVVAINAAGPSDPSDPVDLPGDTTPPELAIHGVDDGAKYPLGTTVTPTCTATDSGSGLAGPCQVSVAGGNANGVGTFTVTATATDRAGNTATRTVQYKIVYRWAGLRQPVDDPEAGATSVSVFKAGSTVPVKFTLRDANGQIIQPASAPIWLTPERGAPTSLPVGESVYDLPSDSGATYRLADDQWQYNWKTTKQQAGYYWRIGVRLDDGETHVVTIALR
ncbi:PxKF domain-containing protein [Dactylosporangium sp. NPDC000521]|uniref:PxKF domain-containing protein n=1 Tax=Dactylosporangium sp. NPDC000521 TaxID=3363975 RepID=UPI0036C9ED4A